MKLLSLAFATLATFQAFQAFGTEKYSEQDRFIKTFDFKTRVAPTIPAIGTRLRIIIDADAANEIDDQWAIALALLSPERFKIEGFVAANFDHIHGGPEGIEKSYHEIKNVLAKTGGAAANLPVYRGSHPMQYKYTPSESEGVDFIIRKARQSSALDPLWIIGLGAATDLASAYLKDPTIRDKVILFWHGRTAWPEKCTNFNVFGDRLAAVTLFHAPVPLVLFDTGGFLVCPMEESEKQVRPHGELGKYLHEFRKTNPWFQQSDKGFFDLGDISALVEPGVASCQPVAAPEVDPDLSYRFKGTKGKILRCHDVDRDRTFGLLYEKLKAAYPAKL